MAEACRSFADEFRSRFADECRVFNSESGVKLSTFAVGGPVELLIEPLSISAVSDVVRYFVKSGIQYRVLGFGSNVIFPDRKFSDPIVRLGRELSTFGLCSSQWKLGDDLSPLESRNGDTTVKCFAFGGSSAMALSRKASLLGLGGLEFAAGIPASIGGTIRMNAGAHGSNIASVLHSAYVLNSSGEVEFRSQNELNFGYRSSGIAPGEIVLGGMFQLSVEDSATVQRRRSECLDYRKSTQPLTYPSAGSVFRNPEVVPSGLLEELQVTKIYAAHLLERCGLKGYALGGVGYSTLHANWLVKLNDNAKSDEVKRLIVLARERVFQHFGIELVEELLLW